MEKQTLINESQIFRRNLLFSIVLIFVLLLLYTVPGYKWAVYEMAIRNKTKIEDMENRRINYGLQEMSLSEKRMFKISNYWYIKYMQDKTPWTDSTVILFPPKAVLDTLSDWKEIANPEWIEYFMYPRIVISEDDKNKYPALYKRVTHVAIMNGWGYDKLTYAPAKLDPFEIFPIVPKKLDSTQAVSDKNTPKSWRGFSDTSSTHLERY